MADRRGGVRHRLGQRGEFVTLVGPSGCGKSTCPTYGRRSGVGTGLRQRWDRGVIQCRLQRRRPPAPWRTVAGNTAVPLEIKGRPREDATRSDADPHCSASRVRGSYPTQLSGGMRRARPPAAWIQNYCRRAFVALDRAASAADRASGGPPVQRATVPFVTHDLDEAAALGDRCVVFSRPGTSALIGRRCRATATCCWHDPAIETTEPKSRSRDPRLRHRSADHPAVPVSRMALPRAAVHRHSGAGSSSPARDPEFFTVKPLGDRCLALAEGIRAATRSSTSHHGGVFRRGRGLLGTLRGAARPYPFLADLLQPLHLAFTACRIALAPLFVLWIGIGIEMKIVLTATVVFFLVFPQHLHRSAQCQQELERSSSDGRDEGTC
jgi:NitT/TauT family transport system ATP-binding protein